MKKILILDPDKQAGGDMEKWLQEIHVERGDIYVRAANTAREALQIIADLEGVDGLITDVDIPGVTRESVNNVIRIAIKNGLRGILFNTADTEYAKQIGFSYSQRYPELDFIVEARISRGHKATRDALADFLDLIADEETD